MASNEITVAGGGGGLQPIHGLPTLAPSSALVPQTFSFSVCKEDSKLINWLIKPDTAHTED